MQLLPAVLMQNPSLIQLEELASKWHSSTLCTLCILSVWAETSCVCECKGEMRQSAVNKQYRWIDC